MQLSTKAQFTQMQFSCVAGLCLVRGEWSSVHVGAGRCLGGTARGAKAAAQPAMSSALHREWRLVQATIELLDLRLASARRRVV